MNGCGLAALYSRTKRLMAAWRSTREWKIPCLSLRRVSLAKEALDGIDQPVQPFPHPRDRIVKFSRRGPLRGEWQLRRPRESDPPAPRALPMFQVVAELRLKLLQRTLDILVDCGSGLDSLAAGQITADNRVTAVEVADERQSPIAPAGAPHLYVELRGFGDLGHLHGHVGERWRPRGVCRRMRRRRCVF